MGDRRPDRKTRLFTWGCAMYVANAAFWWALGAGTAASCQLSGDIPLTGEVLDALRTAANVALLAIPAILCLFPETEQERAARLARRRGP